MRIAMVSPYAMDRPGGVQDQAGSLVSWLQDEGHDAWLVAPGHAGGPEGTIYLGDTVAVRTNRSVAPIRLARGTADAVAEAVLGADVIHIHEPFVPAVSLAALRIDWIPRVATFHADPGRGVRLLYRLARRQWRRLSGNLAEAVAVSPVAADAIRPFLGEPTVIPNTIDVGAYQPDSVKTRTRIAFLGRDEPRKGLDVLLEAFGEVRRTRPDAELIVMGAHREEQPGVDYLGPVDNVEKQIRLAGAAILVAPNLGGESFGLVVLEGMAAGCAVVASSLPAFTYVASDAALYAPPGDVAALVRALNTFLADDDVLSEYQRRAADRAWQFDKRTVVADYLKVYGRAVDKSPE